MPDDRYWNHREVHLCPTHSGGDGCQRECDSGEYPGLGGDFHFTGFICMDEFRGDKILGKDETLAVHIF